MSSDAPAKHIWCCSRCSAIYRKDFPFCPADGGEVIVVDRDPLIGTALDHYTIDALIGEGAMGRVYRAHHTQLTDRHYAVKVLIGDLAATQESRMRFLNEAKSASKLSHPNVVSVIDVGRSAKGLLYLVMELVDGVPLSELLGAPMDPLRAARIIRDVCKGLGHAHDRGLVHRDLKPDNVLLVQTPDGEVPRIVDFGIALHTESNTEQARLTATGMVIGTPAYIAPEQVAGHVVDALADQYSVGVTMFEMLTGGHLPFSGTPAEVTNAKVRGDAPSLDDAMPPGVMAPPGLARMVERMLARKPAQRYGSVHDIVRMLTRYLDAPQTVILDDRPSRAPYLAVGLAAVAVAATAVLWVTREDPRPGHAEAAPPRVAPSVAFERSPAIVPTTPAPTTEAPTPTTEARTTEAPPKQPSRRVASETSSRKKRARKAKPDKPRVERAARVEPVASITPPPEVPPLPTAPPPAPSPVAAKIDGINVSGALSHADVQRAVGRVTGAIGRCTAVGAHSARVQFTIDDSRRPTGMRASGAPSPALACLTAALGAVRTEAAPDVGNADVVVKIGFR